MVVGLTPSCFCYVSKIREDNERGKEKEKKLDGKERQSARKGKEERKTQNKRKGEKEFG